MNDDTPSNTPPAGRTVPVAKPGPGSREDRLRAALRANLARRKAQGRARAAHEQDDKEGHEDE